MGLVEVRPTEDGFYGRSCCWRLEAAGETMDVLKANLKKKVEERAAQATAARNNLELFAEHEKNGSRHGHGSVQLVDDVQPQPVQGLVMVGG